MKTKLVSILATAAFLSTALMSPVAHAAGTASYSLSPNGGSYTQNSNFTLQVHENGASVNVVTAKLTYNPAQLTCTGVGGSTAFANTIVASCSGGSVTISRYTANDPTTGTPTVVSGDQIVGSISFTAIATGSANVSFAAGSQIASAGANIWDGNTAGGTYNINAAVATGTTGGTKGTTSPGTKSTTSTSATTTPAATTTAPTVLSTDSVKTTSKKVTPSKVVTVAPVAKNSTSRDVLTIAGIVILLAVITYLVRDVSQTVHRAKKYWPTPCLAVASRNKQVQEKREPLMRLSFSLTQKRLVQHLLHPGDRRDRLHSGIPEEVVAVVEGLAIVREHIIAV
jgi:hypothetical protein